MTTKDGENFCQSGLKVIDIEAKAIAGLAHYVDKNFARACKLLFRCKGRIIVIGIGKSGHIGNKIAATLASTGSPAFFVHAAEANHGDLGMINVTDVVLGLSYSGETEEIISILPTLKLLKIPLILLTGNPQSRLSQQATVSLNIGITEEACPLGLAPTASSTAALVMGDAIAIALLNARGFTRHDFAMVHPKGRLGRRLLLRVSDIMHTGSAIPNVLIGTPVSHALLEISKKCLGMTVVIDETNRFLGVFTDGDLRRAIEQKLDLRSTRIEQVMTLNAKTIAAGQLATEALRLMEDNKITSLVILDAQKNPLGVVHIHDILRASIK